VSRSSFYRAGQPKGEPKPRPTPERALKSEEKEQVLQVLNSEPFQDSAPREVYATLLDEGQYLCSWSTMYRILKGHKQVRERRNQLRHPVYSKPELLASGPKQLWSWDLTKLRGPAKWTYYYLYTILDVYSRYVPGWLIAERESAQLAEQLIAETCAKQGIEPGQLTLHADRGSSMTSKTVALLLAALGVTKTHSRPRVSNDNPYSESHFKTMKYRPDYPDRFGSIQDARAWARPFFHWYNHEHHHSGLALLTPATVHYGQAQAVLDRRQQVLQAAYAAHPERFVRGMPTPPSLPTEVWINKPSPS
jgi:putative transposase